MESKLYAIVDIGGSQLKVTPQAVVRIPRLRAAVGEEIELEKVLLLSDGSKVEVGNPYLERKSLVAEVVRHGKDRKIIVFKKKKRKGYRRKKGHRQPYTEILIKAIPPVGA